MTIHNLAFTILLRLIQRYKVTPLFLFILISYKILFLINFNCL